MSQSKQILQKLSDGLWHCFATKDFFIKDDRSRISALNKVLKLKGQEIIGAPCDGKCGTKHNSGVKMRRLTTLQTQHSSPSDETCPHCKVWLNHSINCPTKAQKEVSTQGALNI